MFCLYELQRVRYRKRLKRILRGLSRREVNIELTQGSVGVVTAAAALVTHGAARPLRRAKLLL